MKVEFRYDYLGRRIEKRVLPWNPTLNSGAGDWDAGGPTRVTRFVWSGWLMLMELDGSKNVVRQYTRGLDHAGGIGGLLALHDADAALCVVSASSLFVAVVSGLAYIVIRCVMALKAAVRTG